MLTEHAKSLLARLPRRIMTSHRDYPVAVALERLGLVVLRGRHHYGWGRISYEVVRTDTLSA